MTGTHGIAETAVMNYPQFLTPGEIEGVVQRCVGRFLRDDDQLCLRNVHELAMAHKIAEYLQHELPAWHVDLEYNRREDENKVMAGREGRADIVAHIRGARHNLLMVEVKKGNNRQGTEEDFQRLSDVTRLSGDYAYQYGLHLRIGWMEQNPARGDIGVELVWFRDGEKAGSALI